MTTEELLTLEGDFTWDFGQNFFIQTEKGNFVWSCPDYNGDNSITPYPHSYSEWIKPSFGRSKGRHIIGKYVDEGAFLKDSSN